jgi:hypothetical protein
MILFFNQNKNQNLTPAELDLNAGAEYAIAILNQTHNTQEVRNNRNYSYRVQNQFPSWLITESEDNSSYNTINLVQELYNWIFSKNGLDLYPNFENLQNPFYTNEESLKKIYSSLFSNFDFSDFNDIKILREFLISNKQKFIEKKGTEESFKIFIQTFFNSAFNDFKIEYGSNGTFLLNQSNTNTEILSDGRYNQEFSIKLEANIDEKYQDDLISLLKPMGFYFDLVNSENTLFSGTVTSSLDIEPKEIIIS